MNKVKEGQYITVCTPNEPNQVREARLPTTCLLESSYEEPSICMTKSRYGKGSKVYHEEVMNHLLSSKQGNTNLTTRLPEMCSHSALYIIHS